MVAKTKCSKWIEAQSWATAQSARTTLGANFWLISKAVLPPSVILDKEELKIQSAKDKEDYRNQDNK